MLILVQKMFSWFICFYFLQFQGITHIQKNFQILLTIVGMRNIGWDSYILNSFSYLSHI